MSVDLFYCTNAINYTIAAGVLAQRSRRAVLLYERRRFAVRPLQGVLQTPISANTMRLLGVLARIGLLGTVYVPHHRLAKQFAAVLAHSPRVAYLDDGLDTLRKVPANVDLARLHSLQEYHTFLEYQELPSWLNGLIVKRSAAIADVLHSSTQPKVDLSHFDHVFIESPGLDPPTLTHALALDAQRVLVIRHPIEKKRGPVPPGCATVDGQSTDCEGSLQACTGKSVYCGETMVFVLLWHLGLTKHHQLWLQLPHARKDNLVGLPPMRDISLPGVQGWLGTSITAGN